MEEREPRTEQRRALFPRDFPGLYSVYSGGRIAVVEEEEEPSPRNSGANKRFTCKSYLRPLPRHAAADADVETALPSISFLSLLSLSRKTSHDCAPSSFRRSGHLSQPMEERIVMLLALLDFFPLSRISACVSLSLRTSSSTLSRPSLFFLTAVGLFQFRLCLQSNQSQRNLRLELRMCIQHRCALKGKKSCACGILCEARVQKNYLNSTSRH